MSEFHEHAEKNSSLSTLILIAVIILGLLYFLAKGCTNSDKNDATPALHGTGMNVTGTQQVLQG